MMIAPDFDVSDALPQIRPLAFERVLADLERRGSVIQKRENEARHALELTLAECAAERAAIAQEKSALSLTAELYRRFFAASSASASAIIP
jgi:hypothetical protein